ncbi:ABC transporter ATP-binding protein [Allopusillimonas soli]|uniref:ABC transporter ATP-binding protein n=1 Tax=Allopusillimonas soli TaxID=659016 RepID=A0A853FCS5_9BURK|nr:ABC transporter ATP-binding protein [Allopusillimonas soli]NYT38595.1 ABC transporter ATP-binding protein [Allopusillimonas soli]TEA71691.1 ABC transporter ATP-binding protein [Allopusillimonas soli]
MSMLEVKGVTQRFGNLVAVSDVSMAVEKGELRALIGPNGAGKTTFFNLISGFFRPTEGQIFLEGRDITLMPPHARVRLGMARTFQVTEIFPELTVRQNLRSPVELALGLRLRPWISSADNARVKDRVQELLEMGRLEAHADRLTGELSHGDQRATEIMMALALEPRILLLDEPTAGMGSHETYSTAMLIRRLHRQQALTIVLVEHDMRVIFNLADRITVLAEGKVLDEGTPDEIAASEVVQMAYLGKAA